MSNIYNLEPPTSGKVVLKTTAGDIDVELWAKEAPKAVRNFVQLCLEGYYDGCIFHRVLKDFLVQTGDPTGTGTGGESIYGAPFKDEFHSRLRFSHRGIVACANENREHSNGSQFFITLGPTETLQKKHTIFGRVAGNTIYNLMEMNSLVVRQDDRPEEPPVITEAEVLWNPFEDIVPRTTRAERLAAAERAKAEAEAAAKAKKPVKKNVALLSFEDEEDDGGGVAVPTKLKSAHEVIDDARLVKVDTEEEKWLAAQEAEEAAARRAAVQARLAKLSKKAGAGTPAAGAAAGAAAADSAGTLPDDDTEAGFDARMRAQAMARRQALDSGAAPSSRDGAGGARTRDSDEDSVGDSDDDGGGKQQDTQKRRAAALAGGSRAAIVRPSRQMRVEDADLLKPWELKRRQYKQRAKLTGRREADTLAKMREFAASLAAPAALAPEPAADRPSSRGDGGAQSSGAADDEAYAGRVRKDIDHEALKPAAWRIDALQDQEDDDVKAGLDALRGHVLSFPKEAKKGEMDRDMDDDNLMVIDPLLEKGKEKWNKQQAKRKKQSTEWGAAGPSGLGRADQQRPEQRQRR